MIITPIIVHTSDNYSQTPIKSREKKESLWQDESDYVRSYDNLDDFDLSRTERILLEHIMKSCRDFHHTPFFKSNQTIAEKTKMCESTVRYVKKSLEKKGWLKITKRFGNGCIRKTDIVEVIDQRPMTNQEMFSNRSDPIIQKNFTALKFSEYTNTTPIYPTYMYKEAYALDPKSQKKMPSSIPKKKQQNLNPDQNQALQLLLAFCIGTDTLISSGTYEYMLVKWAKTVPIGRLRDIMEHIKNKNTKYKNLGKMFKHLLENEFNPDTDKNVNKANTLRKWAEKFKADNGFSSLEIQKTGVTYIDNNSISKELSYLMPEEDFKRCLTGMLREKKSHNQHKDHHFENINSINIMNQTINERSYFQGLLDRWIDSPSVVLNL